MASASTSSPGDGAGVSESSPLLPPAPRTTPKPIRSVTFNPTISTASPPKRPGFARPASSNAGGAPASAASSSAISTSGREGFPQSTLSALNSKLRRRNSSGAALQLPLGNAASRIGPQRTTRTASKLKLLPNPDLGDDGPDEESGRDVYSQFTRIKDPTARRDAARLGKEDRQRLPRVTAYCTAGSYRIEELMRFLKGRVKTKAAAPKLFDECLYSPYSYRREGSTSDGSRRRRSNGAFEDDDTDTTHVHSQPQRRFSDSAIEVEEQARERREDLVDMSGNPDSRESSNGAPLTSASSHDLTRDVSITTDDVAIDVHGADQPSTPDLDTTVHIPEVFLFEYGVVVIWGMSVKEEQRFLKEISKFEQEKLSKDDVQTEEFNFYYTREYQARIYNDFISLREKKNYMTKLAISHALAQSTKVRALLCPAEDTYTILNTHSV